MKSQEVRGSHGVPHRTDKVIKGTYIHRGKGDLSSVGKSAAQSRD